MTILGGLACWALFRVLKPGYWYVLIGISIFGYIIHGFVLDPAIGYPPWQDHDHFISLDNVSLFARLLSWFTHTVFIAGAVFGGLLFTKKPGQ